MPPKKCADFCAKVYVPAAEKANPTSKNDRSTMTRMRMEECKRAYCNKGCKCTDAKATDAYIRLVEKAQLRGKEPDPAPCKRLVRCPNAAKVIPCSAKGVGEGQKDPKAALRKQGAVSECRDLFGELAALAGGRRFRRA